MSIKLQVANFTGDKNEIVAWVAAIEGKLPGMKKSKVKLDGEDKWVPACSPETILAILDSDHAHLRAVCDAAIKSATPKKVKQAEAPVQYFFLKSGALQLDSANAPRLLSAEEVVANAADDCLFCKVGSAHWATAKDLGLTTPKAVIPPPPPVPVPTLPTTQSVPMSPPAPVTQVSTAAAAMQRIEEAKARTLAAKRAS